MNGSNESEVANSSPMMDSEKEISLASDVAIDKEKEAKLVRKLDYHIVPLVMVLYLAAFLDRVNIGNARLYGLEEDLGLKGNQYQLAVSILFVTYLLLEVPSNLVLKKLRPKWFLSFLCLGWGIVATLTGLTQNLGGLIVCRLFLGALEAGLFPGLTIYLTFFYTRKELALRIGYIFVGAAIAGAFGGLLAYGLGHMDGTSGQRGWRWIFYIEGILSVVIGVISFIFLADDPSTASYLTPEDRELENKRLYRQMGHTEDGEKLHWKDVRAGALDWRTWAFGAAQFGVNNMWYGFSTFLPTMINGIGDWTAAEIQLLTIPCYALGAITYLLVARLSDSQGQRGLYSCGFIVVSIVGYALLLADVPSGVHYFGCFLVAMGLYVAVGLPLAWLPNNLPRYGKRAFSSGFQLTIGSFGGIASPFIYPSDDAPRFQMGQAVSLGLIAFAGIIYGGLWVYYTNANKRRKQGLEDYKIEGKSEDEINEMGDANPAFIYTT